MVQSFNATAINANPPQNVPLTQDNFKKGVISVVNESKLPKDALKEADNYILTEDGAPIVRPGSNWYGNAPTVNTVSTALTAPTAATSIPGNFAWTNPTNIFVSDGVYATSNTLTSAALYASGFGFAIPALATITGVEVDIQGNYQAMGGSARSLVVTLTKTGGVATGNTSPSQVLNANTNTTLVFGGSSNTFNATLTPDDVNNSQFGVLINPLNGGGGSVARIDQVTVRITYQTSTAIDGAAMYVAPDESVHLLMINGGIVSRSLDDGVTWTACTGATFTSGKKVRFEQVSDVMYMVDGYDNIIIYNGTTTLQTYTPLSTPTGASVSKTGLAGTGIYAYRYRVSAVNGIGYTPGSVAQVASVDRSRDQFDASNYVTFTWGAVAGATRYDIYIGETAGDESYVATVTSGTTYIDKGSDVQQTVSAVPEDNTTQGPRVGDIALVGPRLVATRDRDFPYRVWMSGTGRYIGYFSSAYQAAYIDLQKGSQFRPVKVVDYRDGKGTPLITVWCKSKDGRGCIWQGSLDTATIGDTTFLIPNFYKLPASRGTEAPDSVVNVLNDYMYYNSQAFYNLGSRAQYLNLLSTDESSANIRPDVRRISSTAANAICAYYYEAKVYLSVPYNNNNNNAIIVYDTELKAWLPRAFTFGVERFFQYTDTAGTKHLLCWKPGDSKLTEINTVFRGDYNQAFRTSLITGINHVNPKNRFDFMWCEEGEVELNQLQGSMSIELAGISREEGFKTLESKTISSTSQSVSWTTSRWTKHRWTVSSSASSGGTYSEPSIKRYFSIQDDINAYQYRISSYDIRAQHIVRTLQVNGTATQAGKPREWELI